MKNNKTKNYIICGVIVLAIIAVLIAGFFLLKEDNNTPNVNGPTNDFVNGDNTINDRSITASEYIMVMLDANKADRQAAVMLEPWLRLDDVTKTYSYLIGEKFLSNYKIASTSEGVVEIPNNTKRIFLFNTYDDETVNGYIDNYLLLAARAKDAGLFDLYVVNTNIDTMEEFIKNDLGYVQNNPTEEIVEFFEILPDNFLLYVDENNVIQFISSAKNAYSASEISAYVFGTEIPCHELVIELRKYAMDFENAYKEFLAKQDSIKSVMVESIDVFNAERQYSFVPLDVMNLTDIFNGVSVVKTFVSFYDNILAYQGHNVDNENDIYHIHQTYNLDKQLIDSSNYEYFNIIDDASVEIKVYGNSKDEIFAIEFVNGNIKMGIISTVTAFNVEQVKTMVENF